MTIIAEQSAASWQIASNVTDHEEYKIFHKHIARFGPSGILRLLRRDADAGLASGLALG